jgi:hypothetical protein
LLITFIPKNLFFCFKDKNLYLLDPVEKKRNSILISLDDAFYYNTKLSKVADIKEEYNNDKNKNYNDESLTINDDSGYLSMSNEKRNSFLSIDINNKKKDAILTSSFLSFDPETPRIENINISNLESTSIASKSNIDSDNKDQVYGTFSNDKDNSSL